jgi:hypothetical protein
MNWIFQSNPKYYDLPNAVAHLSEMSWLVNQYRNQIHAGDTVYLWEAGGETAGIIAVGHVLTEPTVILPGDEDRKFQRDKERFVSERLRVRIRIDQVLPERILIRCSGVCKFCDGRLRRTSS